MDFVPFLLLCGTVFFWIIGWSMTSMRESGVGKLIIGAFYAASFFCFVLGLTLFVTGAHHG